MDTNKIELKYVDTYTDGGTKIYKDNDGNEYFLDNRLGVKTRGVLYDKYPSIVGAKQLNLEDYKLVD